MAGAGGDDNIADARCDARSGDVGTERVWVVRDRGVKWKMRRAFVHVVVFLKMNNINNQRGSPHGPLIRLSDNLINGPCLQSDSQIVNRAQGGGNALWNVGTLEQILLKYP